MVVVTLGWGLNWPAMKIALNEIPPWTYRAWLSPTSGLVLLIIAGAMKQSLVVPRSQWLALTTCAFFLVTVWQMFIAIGIMQMSSGRAAVLAFTLPLWASIFSIFVLGEAMTKRRAAALVLGMAGIAVLLVGELHQAEGAATGIAFILAAAAAWAAGLVWLKRVKWQVQTLPLAGWQLVIGSIPIIVCAWLFETVDPSTISATAIGATVFSFIWPVCFCNWAFFKIVSLFPASVSAIGTLLVPVIGVISGALFLGEPTGWREVTSLILVCSALSLELLRPAKARPRK